MTGALVAVHITGRNGLTLQQKWAQGPATYLGLMTAGFPNFFSITGPGSPSVLSNMWVSIAQHAERVADGLARLRSQGLHTIEPTEAAEAGWMAHVSDGANITRYPNADFCYGGANVPGKPRVLLPYVGGLGNYRQACDDVVAADDLGFCRSGPAGMRCNDGVLRRMQPDLATVSAEGRRPAPAHFRIFAGRAGTRLPGPVHCRAAARPGGGRDRQRQPARRRRAAGLPAVPAGQPGPAAGGGLGPRRRLGAG